MTRIDPMQRNRATVDLTFDTEKASIINVDEKFQLIYCKNDEFAVTSTRYLWMRACRE